MKDSVKKKAKTLAKKTAKKAAKATKTVAKKTAKKAVKTTKTLAKKTATKAVEGTKSVAKSAVNTVHDVSNKGIVQTAIEKDKARADKMPAWGEDFIEKMLTGEDDMEYE